MNLRVHFEAEAEAEYLQAFRWYERQREGLGVEFLDEIDATIHRVLAAPFSGATVPRLPPDLAVRRLATRRFPYHVVYLVDGETLRILAVAHDRRRPGFWRAATPLTYRRLVTPLGPMLAMAEEAGVVLLEFLDRPALTAELDELKTHYRYAAAPGDHAHLDQLERELASDVGKPGGARIAGRACGRNRIAILIPCHRVVAKSGALTGYGGGKARKAYLLDLERGATSAFAAPT